MFAGQHRKPVLNMTMYNNTKFSSCRIRHTHNILHPVSSYYFQSYTKLFQAGNVYVVIRPNHLYFSIWGIWSKRGITRILWQVKTSKTDDVLNTESDVFENYLSQMYHTEHGHLRLKTRQRSLRLPTRICSYRSRATVNLPLPLRQRWRFQFPNHKLSVP